jgi:hypothetical protein
MGPTRPGVRESLTVDARHVHLAGHGIGHLDEHLALPQVGIPERLPGIVRTGAAGTPTSSSAAQISSIVCAAHHVSTTARR